MKKKLGLLLAIALCLSILAGCGSKPADSPADNTPSSSDAPADTPSSSGETDYTQGDKVLINVASTFPAEGHVHEGIEKFKQYIDEKTNGRIEVVIHPAGALGTTREICEGLKAGTIEMGVYGDEDVEYYCPQYAVFSVPYLFRDAQQYITYMETKGSDLFEAIQKECGIITGTWCYRGARHVTANKEIIEPEDLAGLKFRLPSMPIRIAVFEAYGASPIIVDFSELYMALKTGTADAQENPPETIYSYKYYEAQKYMILTGHIQTIGRYTISENWFKKLSESDQALIMEAWANVHEYLMDNYSNPDQDYIDKCVENGMELVEPNTDRFVEIAKPVIEQWAAENWADGLFEEITTAIASM